MVQRKRKILSSGKLSDGPFSLFSLIFKIESSVVARARREREL